MKICKTLFASLLVCLGACLPTPPPTPLDNLQGQWVYINYWARWCKPCIKEIPELSAFAKQHPNVAVRGVNYDGIKGQALRDLEQELGIDYLSLEHDPAPMIGKKRPTVLPVTWLLNPEGKVVAELLGPQTQDSLRQVLIQAQKEH